MYSRRWKSIANAFESKEREREREKERTNIPRRFLCIENLIVCQVDGVSRKLMQRTGAREIASTRIEFPLPVRNAFAQRLIRFCTRQFGIKSSIRERNRYFEAVFIRFQTGQLRACGHCSTAAVSRADWFPALSRRPFYFLRD